MIVNVFNVCQSGYVEGPKGQVTETLIEKLLFKHDIKPPYTNANQWNIKKCLTLVEISQNVTTPFTTTCDL